MLKKIEILMPYVHSRPYVRFVKFSSPDIRVNVGIHYSIQLYHLSFSKSLLSMGKKAMYIIYLGKVLNFLKNYINLHHRLYASLILYLEYRICMSKMKIF